MADFLIFYSLAGFLFAVFFIAHAFKKLNPEASAAPIALRLLWAFGAFLLWPLLLFRYFRL